MKRLACNVHLSQIACAGFVLVWFGLWAAICCTTNEHYLRIGWGKCLIFYQGDVWTSENGKLFLLIKMGLWWPAIVIISGRVAWWLYDRLERTKRMRHERMQGFVEPAATTSAPRQSDVRSAERQWATF